MKEYLASAEEVLEEQSTSAAQGLTAAEAQTRLANVGPNKLDEEEKTPLWKRFFEQMADPMVIMLLVAAAISVITGFIQGEPEWADAAIILSVVILNSVLGVVQEAKSEQALEALQEMSAAQSKVIRDGKMVHMASSELVPGDVVLLEAGDSVPADCRVLESASMKIEEAALTGESVPVEKHANTIELGEGMDDVPLGDRKNMCYMGSTVVYGRGRAVVVGTGMNTEMGKIATALTQAKKELTPLQMKLNELSGILTKLVLAICVIIFAVDIVRHFGELGTNPGMLLDTFMVAVSLAVAAIPRAWSLSSPRPVHGCHQDVQASGHYSQDDRRRDSRMHPDHLLRQDRHPHPEQDDRCQARARLRRGEVPRRHGVVLRRQVG